MPKWTYQQLDNACWAVAARDCALERGDADAAALFAQQARDAIADVLATGTSLPELAHELDYPGGAAEIDGPHIDQQIAALPDDALPAVAGNDHNADGDDLPSVPDWGPLPQQMLDALDERRTGPVTSDDPTALLTHLDELREQIASRAATSPGPVAAATDDDVRVGELTRWAQHDLHTDEQADDVDVDRGW